MAHGPANLPKNNYLVIGRWDHGGTQKPRKGIEGVAIPDAAVLDMENLHVDWYDWVLGRGPKPEFLHDRVAYFMLGANEWQYASSLDAASSGKTVTLFVDDREGTPKDMFHSGLPTAFSSLGSRGAASKK